MWYSSKQPNKKLIKQNDVPSQKMVYISLTNFLLFGGIDKDERVQEGIILRAQNDICEVCVLTPSIPYNPLV